MYEGCSPRVSKPRVPHHHHKHDPTNLSLAATLSKSLHSGSVLRREMTQAPNSNNSNNTGGNSRTSQLMAMLSQGASVRATVPSLVTDIMNLESLLSEDDDEDIGLDTEENLYTALLQIADQRLYKIVRWARSLPDFAVISVSE